MATAASISVKAIYYRLTDVGLGFRTSFFIRTKSTNLALEVILAVQPLIHLFLLYLVFTGQETSRSGAISELMFMPVLIDIKSRNECIPPGFSITISDPGMALIPVFFMILQIRLNYEGHYFDGF